MVIAIPVYLTPGAATPIVRATKPPEVPMKRLALLAFAAAAATAAHAAPQSILFVGNSYTFGRVDPVMSYNAANVDDMTRPRPLDPEPNFTDVVGTRAW